MFDNFNIYNDKSYDECNNIIFKSCIRQYRSSTLDLKKIDLLEDALQFVNVLGFDTSKKEFKDRITSCIFSESRSAFQEITITYKIGQAVGNANIQYNASLPESSRKPDVCVSLDGEREICLEITSVSTSETDKKLYGIFYNAAKYLYNKIPQQYKVSVRVDTTKLPLNSKQEIDEEKSNEMMRDQINRICFDQIDDTPNLLITPNDQLFQSISLKYTCTKSVYIEEDEIHYDPPQKGSGAYLQRQASLMKIKKKIKTKAALQQYKIGSPAILVVYWQAKTLEYENSENHFCYIKNHIASYLQPYPALSGIFLFHSDNYINGKFIHNPAANENVQISEAELDQVFYTNCEKF